MLKIRQLIYSYHFYVMPQKAMILSIILGTPWQRKYKAVPDWETNSIKIKQTDGYVYQPFISLEAKTNNTKQIRQILHKGKEVVSPTQVTKRTKKQTTTCSSTTTSTFNQKLMWKPKQPPLGTHQASTAKPFKHPQGSSQHRDMCQRSCLKHNTNIVKFGCQNNFTTKQVRVPNYHQTNPKALWRNRYTKQSKQGQSHKCGYQNQNRESKKWHKQKQH